MVKYWLLNFTGYSNRRIADEIGVGKNRVEAKRQEMESTGLLDQLDKLEGKNGKIYPRTITKKRSVSELETPRCRLVSVYAPSAGP